MIYLLGMTLRLVYNRVHKSESSTKNTLFQFFQLEYILPNEEEYEVLAGTKTNTVRYNPICVTRVHIVYW